MGSRTWTRTFAAVGLPALAAASVAVAAGGHHGSLDKSFGKRGSTLLPSKTRLFAVAQQRDGKIVAVGESGAGSRARLLVARFTSSGSLDRSFGRRGLAVGPAVHTARGSASIGRAVVIQRDGKIVVVGKATSSDGSGRFGLLVERFTSRGTLDRGFGSGGVVNLMSTSFGDGYAATLLSSGKIVATGSADAKGSGNGTYPRAAIVRLTGNGRPDRSFGKHGIDVIDLGPFSYALGVAASANGKIVITGSQSPKLQATQALVARVTPSGGLDHSFNGSGFFTHAYSKRPGVFSAFNAVAVQRNGKIVAVGSATSGTRGANMIAARFSPSGGQQGVTSLQSAKQWTEVGNVVPGASAVSIAPNGEIIAAGQFADGVVTSATLWAFTAGGGVDRSFGQHGVAKLKLKSGANSEALGVTAGRSGAVLVGDAEALGKPPSGLVARFH